MTSKTKTIAAAVISTAVGVAFATATPTVMAGSHKNMVKCYGVAKAGKNDCGTKAHACAGQSKTDGATNEWIYMTKGNCERIVGGSLTPSDKKDAPKSS